MSREEMEKEKAASHRYINRLDVASTEFQEVRDEYGKGSYRWQGQKIELTNEERKDMKKAQQKIKDIYKDMKVDAHSVLNK